MSKTVQTLIDKADRLAKGLKRNLHRVQQQGIDNADIARIETEIEELRATDRAVEEAFAHLTELRTRNNDAIRRLNIHVQNAKKTIKHNYEKTEWYNLGVTDKQ